MFVPAILISLVQLWRLSPRNPFSLVKLTLGLASPLSLLKLVSLTSSFMLVRLERLSQKRPLPLVKLNCLSLTNLLSQVKLVFVSYKPFHAS